MASGFDSFFQVKQLLALGVQRAQNDNPFSFGFHHDQTLEVRNERPDHPITQGLQDWEMVDETYTMADPGPDCEILLTADHPQSMRTLAWTRHYRNSRVFCFQSGHDNQTWVHPNFREVVRRGLLWCAQRI